MYVGGLDFLALQMTRHKQKEVFFQYTLVIFLCTVSTHPSTAGLCSGLGDLSCSGWEGDSASSAAPGNIEEGQLWPADTCSLSSGSDSEEGGWDSRAERSINSSCHKLERDQVMCQTFFFVMPCARAYLWERVGVLTDHWWAVLQEAKQHKQNCF